VKGKAPMAKPEVLLQITKCHNLFPVDSTTLGIEQRCLGHLIPSQSEHLPGWSPAEGVGRWSEPLPANFPWSMIGGKV
jgi:hypothetical protein